MAIRGDGYSMPSKISARMSDGPPTSEVCCLMQLCVVSLTPNELSERPRSALRDLIKEPALLVALAAEICVISFQTPAKKT